MTPGEAAYTARREEDHRAEMPPAGGLPRLDGDYITYDRRYKRP
jgi:hypothetical protein